MVPYIGITDFTEYSQVEDMLRVFSSNLPLGSNRVLHVGVMMSYKTLHGIPSDWSNVFPPKEKIPDIFASDDVYNCLHYADYSRDPELWRSLSTAISHCGIGINAIQLDMVWPDPGQVAHGVHTSRRQIDVILQIGERALDEAGGDPDQLVERLRDYEGVINRVLLDRSMGRGIPLDAEKLLPFALAIRENFPDFGIVAAGGLGPETVHLITPLIAAVPDMSIDAQGQLRPSGNCRDPIDWRMAGDYLINAIPLFP